ncbi:hypothetical protein LIER_27058 [Lithospermum erythrorhizon]|uniref:Uncharacterized protein n=1 Tax=Lithospermum erythrorhizon TaxID=34254 RepID=A0AAV3RBV7_LITER
MGILMIMMASTMYDAYEVTNIYEGLKLEVMILDHHKCGLKKRVSRFREHVKKESQNRTSPTPQEQEYEFLSIGFTFRDLPSLEERFDALERKSDMSKLLKSKRNQRNQSY